MLLAIGVLLPASVLASGILFRHYRIVTFLSAAGVIGECSWLTLTLLHRIVFTTIDVDTLFFIGSLLFLTMGLLGRRRWRWPRPWWGWPDLIILAVLAPVLGSAWLIQGTNGFVGTDWVAHGYYNGDTATLAALVQRSITTAGLVGQNPFAGNGPLEYPTLIHAGLAEIIMSLKASTNWLSFLPVIVLTQILITVPLFFLLRDVAKDIPGWPSGYRWGWRGVFLEGGLVGYVLAISWESYVYPQGHFFTTALFIFLVTLLARAWGERGLKQLLWSVLASLVVILLVLSNSVTGTAAAVVWTIFALLRGLDQSRSASERGGYGASIVVLMIFFFLNTTPGAGHLSLTPWFSYTAAHSFALLAAAVVLLLLAVFTQLRQHVLIGTMTVALCGLGLVTFVFSDRELIIDNASRFLYHGILVGWPLAVDGFVRSARVLAARRRHLAGTFLPFVGACALAIICILLAVPAASSVAEVHDQLLFKNTTVSGATAQLAMQWISTHTAPDAVFLASPEEPWEIPLFTGRALLRTEYWLSPEDEVHDQVVAALAGDVDAQRLVLPRVDYVLLRGSERARWTLPAEQLIERFGDIDIYDVRGTP